MFSVLCFVIFLAQSLSLQYQLDPSWPKLPLDSGVSGVSAAAFDASAQEIYVLQRGSAIPPIMVYDKSGELLRTWGGVNASRIVGAGHGLHVQQQSGSTPLIWITDSQNCTVQAFDVKGKRVVLLGVSGDCSHGLYPLRFGSVADLTTDSEGNIYISDGDGGVNDRIVKLDKNLQLLWSVGLNSTGSGPSQFNSPHSLAYQARFDRLFVADRENNRTQVISGKTGAYLGEWKANGDCEPLTPWSVRVDESSQLLFVVDSGFQTGPLLQGRLIVFDVSQELDQSSFPKCTMVSELDVGQSTSKAHEVGFDEATGDIYIAFINVPPQVSRYVRS